LSAALLVKPGKIGSLEALRGLAALSVVFGHLCAGFEPFRFDPNAGGGRFPLAGTPLFILVNGEGAVSLFFVLSGFVLTWGYFERPRGEAVLRALLKRWPRLAGPTTLATLFGAALFAFGGKMFVPAGVITGSSWLQSFAGSPIPPAPGIIGPLLQGGFRTFFANEYSYDTSLWTMRTEILGSGLVLLMAYPLRQARSSAIALLLALVASVFLYVEAPRMIEFIIGACLSRVMANRSGEMPSAVALLLIGLGLYLMAYSGPAGIFAWIPRPDGHSFWIWDVGAVALIAPAVRYAPFRRLLSIRPARLLGILSFPIYLVHAPLLCVVGSAAFLRGYRYGMHTAVLSTVASTLIATFVAALLLSGVEQWWIRRVNAASVWLVPER
jgi:peptidoglycan/LPS O-acetylase OafA/YrhL